MSDPANAQTAAKPADDFVPSVIEYAAVMAASPAPAPPAPPTATVLGTPAPTQQGSSGTGGGPAPGPNALYAVGSRLREYASSMFQQRKPWTEVADRTSFSRPANVQEAMSRLRKNAAYFRINYLIAVLASVAISFVMHPSSLFVLAFLMASWVYVFVVRTAPLEIGGRQLSDREKFMALSAGSFVVVFFLTSVGSVLFTALMFSFAVIGAHGATRVPDDLFLEEADSQQSLLSIFTGGAAQSATGVNSV